MTTRRTTRQDRKGAMLLLLVCTALPGAVLAQAPDPALTLYGDTAVVGEGVIRSWVERASGEIPYAVGVTLPERTFPALTDEGFMLSLDYPELEGLPFRHVLFDWVPMGHPPEALYAHAHWDAHFYTISAEDRRAIPEGFVEDRPDPRYMPAGYVPVPELDLFSFEAMGVHWVSSDAPELHDHTFDQTLIYGSIGERTIFVEPMFTMAFLEGRPDFSAPIPQPAAVHESGYYATRYVIRYLPDEAAYRVALEGFRWRESDGR
jgi:hypothetical protein